MPRFRSQNPRLRAFRAGLLCGAAGLALWAAIPGARAQAVMSEVDPLSPEVMWNPRTAQGFRGGQAAQSNNARGKAAAVSGYDSSNGAAKLRARRRALAAPAPDFKPAPPVLNERGRIESRATALPPQAPVLTSEWTSPVLESSTVIAPLPAPARRPSPVIGPYEPLGLRVGTFIVKPAVEVFGGVDSNPSRTPQGRRSLYGVVAPELAVASDWSVHDLRAVLRGTLTEYQDQPSLNRPYFASRVDGRVDVSRHTQIDLQQRFVTSREDPGSPNAANVSVTKLPTYFSVGGTAGLTHRFNRLEVSGKLDIDRTAYEDSTLSNGASASNADRNFNQYAVGLRGAYEFSPSLKPFVAVTLDTRKHDEAQDRFGQRRDSNGVTPRVGAFFELSRLVTGTASIGYVTRHYDDPTLAPLGGVVADASVAWAATKITTVTFGARSAVDESTQPGVSGILSREFSGQVDHDLRRWLTGTVKAGYGVDSFYGVSREDQRYWAAFALTYKMSREVQIKGEARREGRTSNVPGNDYTANIFTLGVRLQR